MMIRVSGVTNVDFYDHSGQQQSQSPLHTEIHYYNPEDNKEKVKDDFDLILDTELRKLKVNILI